MNIEKPCVLCVTPSTCRLHGCDRHRAPVETDINDLRAGIRKPLPQSLKHPADEHFGAFVTQLVAGAVPIVAVVWLHANWLEATISWGICSTVAQLMHINAHLKTLGTRKRWTRRRGGGWQREP